MHTGDSTGIDATQVKIDLVAFYNLVDYFLR